jgi:hypothetical protein
MISIPGDANIAPVARRISATNSHRPERRRERIRPATSIIALLKSKRMPEVAGELSDGTICPLAAGQTCGDTVQR